MQKGEKEEVKSEWPHSGLGHQVGEDFAFIWSEVESQEGSEPGGP